ncbi:MAG: GNAT family N-acetyltransferase [Anaerolineae bacterium]|nr:GNAT family N-acetyltransferase [Anaerolineae bacterium]
MAESVTTVIRGAHPDEREQIARLYAGVFSTPDMPYDMLYALNREGYVQEPGFRHEHTRVVVRDGQVIAQVKVNPFAIHYGAATLTAAGLGDVCTHPDHRGQGHATDLMRDTLAYVADIGCDLALLNGVTDYYHRFDFANAWPYRHVDVYAADTDRLTRAPASALALRAMTDDDIPAMLALYNRTWPAHPGARIRDAAYLAWKLSGFNTKKVVAVDDAGQLRGYMVDWWTPGAVCEVVAASADATAAFLRASAATVRAAYGDDDAAFRWFVPPDAPAARHARRLCPVEIMERSRPGGGWMARLIDLPRTVEKLLPELEARVQRSPYADWAGYLRLETDLGHVTLALSHGRIMTGRHTRQSLVAQMRQTDLVELMFAYSTPAEVAAQAHAHIDREALGLLRALFPPVVSGMAGIDWF